MTVKPCITVDLVHRKDHSLAPFTLQLYACQDGVSADDIERVLIRKGLHEDYIAKSARHVPEDRLCPPPPERRPRSFSQRVFDKPDRFRQMGGVL